MSEPKQPNILILMADQHRTEINGCYGHPVVRTPNIDRIAARGTRFDRAFCASPLCGPSRMAFLTGADPNTNWNVMHPNSRHRSGKVYRAPINPATPSLVQQFRRAGYRTYGCGYLGAHGHIGDRQYTYDDAGFDRFECDKYAEVLGDEAARQYNFNGIFGEMWEPNYQNVDGNVWPFEDIEPYDTHVARAVNGFLDEQDGNRPFLAYCGFRAPHPPWVPPREFAEQYDPADAIVPNYKIVYRNKPRRVMERLAYYDCRYYPEDVVRLSIARYYGFVAYLDACVGMILDELEKTGLAENTLIIYASDHGELLYNNGLCEKHSFFEGAISIPLLMSLPGMIPEGAASQELVSNVDVLPTALSVCGMPIPDVCDGKDLRPVMRGESVRDAVFAEYYHSLDPSRMMRGRRYKYIHTEDDIDELYDLNNDPLEQYNLAFLPAYSELVDQMEARVLADWDIPDIPLYGTWNDLNERKQRQLRAGLPIHDFRPPMPAWTEAGPGS